MQMRGLSKFSKSIEHKKWNEEKIKELPNGQLRGDFLQGKLNKIKQYLNAFVNFFAVPQNSV